MPLSPDSYIRCVSDGWIAVRDAQGRLLGAIPGSPPDQDYIPAAPPLGAVAVWSAMTFCLVPTDEQIPLLKKWEGFVPVDDFAAQTALAQPVGFSEGEPP